MHNLKHELLVAYQGKSIYEALLKVLIDAKKRGVTRKEAEDGQTNANQLQPKITLNESGTSGKVGGLK